MVHLKFLTMWYKSYYIWLHVEPALVILIFFSSLTASPQVSSQQSSSPGLLSNEEGIEHIGKIAGLPGKTKLALPFSVAQLTSLLHHYKDGDFVFGGVKNSSPKQEIYIQNYKISNQHLQILHFILLHSKHFSLLYQMCASNFMKNEGYTGKTGKGTEGNNLGTKLKEASQPDSYPHSWHVVASQFVGVQKHASSVLENENKFTQNLINNEDSKTRLSQSFKASVFDGASSYPYCANVIKKLFIPLAAYGESTQKEPSNSNYLRTHVKNVRNGYNIKSGNKINLKRNIDRLVRRKKSVHLQSPLLKQKSSNEFNAKSSSLNSKMITEILTESISNLYPTKLQDTDVKTKLFLGNSKLGKWLNAIVKKINDSDFNITQLQDLKNISFTDEFKNIPNLTRSLSLFLDLTRHEGTANLSNNTSHERKETQTFSENHSLKASSHTVSSENLPVNLTASHSNVPEKNVKVLTTVMPRIFIPVTDNSDGKKVALNLPNLKTMHDNDGETSVTSSVDVSSSVVTDFPNVISTLTVEQQEMDGTQNSEFPAGVQDVNESVPSVIPVTNKGLARSEIVSGSDKRSRTAMVVGVVLSVVVLLGFFGTVLLVVYRRYFLNKPQTFNDKCSNPDSSGYIDDSTLRENSEEMYSLDNDSFLNSLEAMTIQNYWTDSVKHTKL